MQIGRLNGFQKMFALLVVADDELQSEILKTLRFFLQLDAPPTSVGIEATAAECSSMLCIVINKFSFVSFVFLLFSPNFFLLLLLFILV